MDRFGRLHYARLTIAPRVYPSLLSLIPIACLNGETPCERGFRVGGRLSVEVAVLVDCQDVGGVQPPVVSAGAVLLQNRPRLFQLSLRDGAVEEATVPLHDTDTDVLKPFIVLLQPTTGLRRFEVVHDALPVGVIVLVVG